MNNRLFVAYKPINISSNHYLSRLKRKYSNKKAGFSGTLDPFAKGCLIVAFGRYTKLLPYLKKSQKRYIATLWLGAKSPTLDIEGVKEIKSVHRLKISDIEDALEGIRGKVEYSPPLFCAKKVDGKRLYEYARAGDVGVKIKNIESTIFDIKLLKYNHPFITFDITISEGGYIRSMGELIASKLDTFGSLSSLERVSEGEFKYDGEKALNPLNCINVKKNSSKLGKEDIIKGVKIDINDLEIKNDGIFYLNYGDFFSIISIDNGIVKYKLNRVDIC